MNTNVLFNAGIYIRLSREDEKDKESSSIESQRDYLIKYLNTKGYKYVNEYVDDGYTGTNFDRPSFKRLLFDIEKGIINMIVVKDLSRLGRNNSKVSYYLDEYFPLYKVRFIAVDNDYDSYIQNSSQEYAWITNGINESYCLDISKKVRSALKVRKEKGYFTGWKAPYGYKRSDRDYHKLVVDEEASGVVRRIFLMAYDGKTPSQIANILSSENILTPSNYANLNRGIRSTAYGLWCTRTVADILTNETYIGNLTQGRRRKINYKLKKEVRVPKEDWIVIKNTHDAIIDDNIFYTVQKLLEKKRGRISKNSKLLSGFIFCKECGHSISVNKSSDGRRYYLGCSYYRKYSKFGVCTPHTMNYKILEDIIKTQLINICKKEICIKNIVEKLDKESIIKRKINDIDNQIRILTNNINSSNKLIDSAYIDMKKNIINLDMYKRIVKDIGINIDKYSKKVQVLNDKMVNLKKSYNCRDYFKLVKELLDFQNPTRSFIANLIDKIYISEDKKIEIYFKFKTLNYKDVIK